MKSRDDQDKQHIEAAAFRQTQRQRLRHERIAAREALSAAAHARKSAALMNHLYRLLTQLGPRRVACYWPIRAEPDCRPLMHRLAAEDWHTCLPFILERHSALRFREWNPESVMVAGEYGIPVAAEGDDVIPEVLLMPVNAFDNEGYRLGYGGGYFDRTLAALNPRPYCIGVGFDLARVASISPTAQDFALDAVVTESGVIRFAATHPAQAT